MPNLHRTVKKVFVKRTLLSSYKKKPIKKRLLAKNGTKIGKKLEKSIETTTNNNKKTEKKPREY
jgi:hypothetical protein